LKSRRQCRDTLQSAHPEDFFSLGARIFLGACAFARNPRLRRAVKHDAFLFGLFG